MSLVWQSASFAPIIRTREIEALLPPDPCHCEERSDVAIRISCLFFQERWLCPIPREGKDGEAYPP